MKRLVCYQVERICRSWCIWRKMGSLLMIFWWSIACFYYKTSINLMRSFKLLMGHLIYLTNLMLLELLLCVINLGCFACHHATLIVAIKKKSRSERYEHSIQTKLSINSDDRNLHFRGNYHITHDYRNLHFRINENFYLIRGVEIDPTFYSYHQNS